MSAYRDLLRFAVPGGTDEIAYLVESGNVTDNKCDEMYLLGGDASKFMIKNFKVTFAIQFFFRFHFAKIVK